jgi:hypothetical protein
MIVHGFASAHLVSHERNGLWMYGIVMHHVMLFRCVPHELCHPLIRMHARLGAVTVSLIVQFTRSMPVGPQCPVKEYHAICLRTNISSMWI